MSLKVVIVFLCLHSVFTGVLVRSADNVVKTTSGSVRGLTVHALNKTIDQYLAIPYAEPPVGALRFGKPKPIIKPIEGVIDATKHKYSCIQKDSLVLGAGVSEDCLTLNVWAPKTNSTKLRPVMFWIYGGALKGGSINIPFYNGSVLASHDVVVVSVNYRLGFLGFLYGGDDSAPGNVGFYDQILGLKWVRDNIHLFGGDKDKITIFGESAGSWSVSVHILSPLSKGLFKRAIMESGAHFYNRNRPVVSKAEALEKAKQVAKRVNCTDEKHWLECLRKVDPKKLMPENLEFIFPLEGTELLPGSSQKAFEEGKFNSDIDLIAGVVHDEGSSLSRSFFNELKGNFTKKQFDGLVQFSDSIYHNIDIKKAEQIYLSKVNISNSSELQHAFYRYFGDLVITCPTHNFAKSFTLSKENKKNNKNIYFYQLTYEGTFMKYLGCDEKTMGICHGADVEFVFGVPVISPTLGSKLDYDFSLEVMKMWTNFAKNGEPGSNWPKVNSNPKVHSRVKLLNPHNSTAGVIDPFGITCDEYWDYYFK